VFDYPPYTDQISNDAFEFEFAFESAQNQERGRKKSRKWRNFSHYKESWVDPLGEPITRTRQLRDYYVPIQTWIEYQTADFLPCLIGAYDKDFFSYFGGSGTPFEGLPVMCKNVGATDTIEVPLPVNLQDLTLRALRSMGPRVKKKLSIVNSVIELKDLVTFRSSLARIDKTSLSLFRDIKFGRVWETLARKTQTRKTFREMLQTAADSYLQYKFNIAPLISDIEGIRDTLSGVNKHLNKCLTSAGLPVIDRYSYDWQELESIPPEIGDRSDVESCIPRWDPPFSTLTTVRPIREVFRAPTVYHAQMRYTTTYTPLQRLFATELGVLDGIGLNFNAAIIWNAIPWSFVIDWFLGVQDLLDRYSVGFMDPEIVVLQYMWSIKRKELIGQTLLVQEKNGSSDPYAFETARVKLPTIIRTAYRRSVGLPPASWLSASGLSPTETSLGAALVLLQGRRFRKKRKRKHARGLNWLVHKLQSIRRKMGGDVTVHS